MLTAEYLLDLGKRAADTLKDYLNDKDGWTVLKKTTDDIIIESKPSPCEGFSHGYLYRGQCDIACDMETVFKYVEPMHGDSLRRRWDTDTKDIELVRHLSPIGRIVRTYTNSAAMGLISPRDFIDLVYTVRTDEYLCNAGQSLESDEWPHVPKFVRGHNYTCGFIVVDVPGKPQKSSRLFTFIQPDIKGSLPSSLVNSAVPKSMVGFFTNLKKCLKKDGHMS